MDTTLKGQLILDFYPLFQSHKGPFLRHIYRSIIYSLAIFEKKMAGFNLIFRIID
jgi:hypothetical protein